MNIHPRIGSLYMIAANSTFVSLKTGAEMVASDAMSVELQGEWFDPETLEIIERPYEADPVIIEVEQVLVDGEWQNTNTNYMVEKVMWSSPMGHCYTTATINLQNMRIG